MQNDVLETQTLETIVSPAPDAGITAIEAVSVPEDAATDAPAEGPTAPDYQQLSLRVAQAAQQIIATGDQLVALLINPAHAEAFTAAFRQLPEQFLPAQVRDGLPIEADPEIETMQLLTRLDLETNFLTQYYGPREGGGNGFIQELEEYLQRNQCPVRVNLEFLRAKFLNEAAARIAPKIVLPGAQPLFTPQQLVGGGRR